MKPLRTLLQVSMVLVGCFGQAEEFALAVRGEVKSEPKLALSELQAFPISALTVAERDGKSANGRLWRRERFEGDESAPAGRQQ